MVAVFGKTALAQVMLLLAFALLLASPARTPLDDGIPPPHRLPESPGRRLTEALVIVEGSAEGAQAEPAMEGWFSAQRDWSSCSGR